MKKKPSAMRMPFFPLRLCALAFPNSQRGATLIVTLGILTVLSILAVAFFSTSRIQRQTAIANQYRDITRNQLNEALYRAMQLVERSYTSPAFDTFTDSSELRQRLAPVNGWFTQAWLTEYASSNGVSPGIFDRATFLAPDILGSPFVSNTVNLLTSEVLALVPPALTNGLSLTRHDPEPHFRSGWTPLDLLSSDEPWKDIQARIAFTVFNLSGFIDANHFVTGSTTQKHARVVFSQADVTNWVEVAEAYDIVKTNKFLSHLFSTFKTDPNLIPFSSISYDPDPDTDPFHPNSTQPLPHLGTESYARGHFRKFDVNSVTNWIGVSSDSEDGETSESSNNWLISPALMANWLRPIANALFRTNRNTGDGQSENESGDNRDPDHLTTLQRACTPWNLLNFIDEDRIPQLSIFAGIDLATRHNAAVEDVPLINKVTVFDIGNAPDGLTSADYGIEDYAPPGVHINGYVSNHYAVAVELWYPFAPHSPPPSCAAYIGVYTNQDDVGDITFERPLTLDEIQNWFEWNEAATSNTVMQTLFYAWANAYTNAVGPSIWNHPLWQVVTTNSEYWFTTNMVNHPSWPSTNGTFTITNTPIWEAFYPDTYEVYTTNQVEQIITNEIDNAISTNLVDVVTTNVYTYLMTTNDHVYWVSEPYMTTNRLIGQIGITEPDPYPVLLWEDIADGTLITNVLAGFTDTPSGNGIAFFSTNEIAATTNHLQTLYASPPDGIVVVYSNGLDGVISTNFATDLVLAPWTTNAPLDFAIQTNLYVGSEEHPVPPLPMPPDLGEALEALFIILMDPRLNTSDALEEFLLRRIQDFDNDWWDFLTSYLAQYPLIQSTIIPSFQEPTLGNLTDEDRYPLTALGDWQSEGIPLSEIEDAQGATVGRRIDNPTDGFGTYWVIYPRRTVSFRETTVITPADTASDTTEVLATNYCAIGSVPGQTGELIEGNAPDGVYRVFFRPVVTVIPADDDRTEHDAPSAENNRIYSDRIVDEALLHGNSVLGWNAATNRYVADPRHNAYADYWLPNDLYPIGSIPAPNRPQVQEFADWNNGFIGIGTTNLSTEVTEYPFIHFNAPLASKGDIGHIYTSPDRLGLTRIGGGLAQSQTQGNTDPNRPVHDTISFASRSGAALLDLFTVHATATDTNNSPLRAAIPWRGLAQANTEHGSVISTLFADARLGWTNVNADITFTLTPDELTDMAHTYLDALTNMPTAGMGWRSYADMLPAVATNTLNPVAEGTFTPPSAAPAHDWTEDALRGIVDKISFRQNIFVIVVAAQTLSPLSTESRPMVLADQRAAVTVIRDAFTGRWVIHSWRWLTE